MVVYLRDVTLKASLMSNILLDTLASAFDHDLTNHARFVIDEKEVGWIAPDLGDAIIKHASDYFEQTANNTIALHKKFDSIEKRTQAMDEAITSLVNAHALTSNPFGPHHPVPTCQHDERLALYYKNRDQHLLTISRYYAFDFGIETDAVTLNLYNDHGYWLAKRSDKINNPSHWDHSAGGMWSVDHATAKEMVATEAYEEAGIPKNLSDQAIFIKKMKSFLYHKNDTQFINENIFMFDLKAPNNFIPAPDHNHEVAGLILVPFDTLTKMIADPEEKIQPVTRIVISDFLIRHSHATSNNFGDYTQIKDILDEREQPRP